MKEEIIGYCGEEAIREYDKLAMDLLRANHIKVGKSKKALRRAKKTMKLRQLELTPCIGQYENLIKYSFSLRRVKKQQCGKRKRPTIERVEIARSKPLVIETRIIEKVENGSIE